MKKLKQHFIIFVIVLFILILSAFLMLSTLTFESYTHRIGNFRFEGITPNDIVFLIFTIIASLCLLVLAFFIFYQFILINKLHKILYYKILKDSFIDNFLLYKTTKIEETTTNNQIEIKLLLPEKTNVKRILSTISCKFNIVEKGIIVDLTEKIQFKELYFGLDTDVSYFIPFEKINTLELSRKRVMISNYSILNLNMKNRCKNIFIIKNEKNKYTEFLYNQINFKIDNLWRFKHEKI